MAYRALYREYRPKTFDEVVGQKHIVGALRNSIKSGRIGHAYLFCGTRGTGKTSLAKIYARAVNCTDPKDGNPCNKCPTCLGILSERLLDVIEIDAASNNSVDNVRDIRGEVVYLPAEAKYKVYIVDEVHMLSPGAFNALLKTLEEPPAHVIFILATTDPNKLPATILSRCQRFDFRRIPAEDIRGKLESVCAELGVKAEEKALDLISRLAEGALRDALSILDRCISLTAGTLTFAEVSEYMGLPVVKAFEALAEHIFTGSVDGIINSVDEAEKTSPDLKQYLTQFLGYLRNLLVCTVSSDPSPLILADETTVAEMSVFSKKLGREKIVEYICAVGELLRDFSRNTGQRILMEVALIKLALGGSAPVTRAEPGTVRSSNEDLTDKIAESLKKSGNISLAALLNGIKTGREGKGLIITVNANDSARFRMLSKTENLELLRKAAAEVTGDNEISVGCRQETEAPAAASGMGIEALFEGVPIKYT